MPICKGSIKTKKTKKGETKSSRTPVKHNKMEKQGRDKDKKKTA